MKRSLPFRTLCYTFLRPLWERNKVMYSLTVVGLLITGITSHLPFLFLLTGPLVILYAGASGLLIFTVVGFRAYGMPSSVLADQDSTYPKGIFTLPIDTYALALCPIVIGAIGFAFLWLPFVATTIIPQRMPFPWEFPLIAVIAGVGWIHAMWMAVRAVSPTGYLIRLLLVLVAGVGAFGIHQGSLSYVDQLALQSFYPHSMAGSISWLQEGLVLGAVALFSIVTALWVVPIARHQLPTGQPKSRRIKTARVPAPPTGPPFLSSLDAQTWFESARYVYLVPTYVVLTTLLIALFPRFGAMLFGTMPSVNGLLDQRGFLAYMPLPLVIGASLGAALLFGTNSTQAATMKI